MKDPVALRCTAGLGQQRVDRLCYAMWWSHFNRHHNGTFSLFLPSYSFMVAPQRTTGALNTLSHTPLGATTMTLAGT